MSDNNEEKKEIEIVNGDGSDLDISPVYEHIEGMKPRQNDKKPKNIVIPGQKKDDRNEENSN